jgi:hypothetical protein
VVETTYQGLQWKLAPGSEALLPEVLQQAGEPVKKSSVTLVTRHRLADRVFYLKRYLHEERLLWPAKYFFKPPRSAYEWRCAPQLEKRGIAIVPHLAYGERRSWRGLLESALLTEGPAGYESFVNIADLQSADPQRALGQFVRRLHDTGVVHQDCHPKNLLYSTSEHAFCLVDLDKITLQQALQREERLDNLALFAARIPLTAVFFEGYGTEFVAEAPQIIERGKLKRQELMKAISRRWRQHTHDLIVQDVGGLRWYVRATRDNEQLRKVMENPQVSGVNGETGLAVEQFHLGAARRAYQEAYRLELMGQGTAHPVAVGEKQVLGICLQSYFVVTV